MNRDVRAFSIGVGVFVGLYALYWAALSSMNDLSPLVGGVLIGFAYAVPLVAGGVTAALSLRHQFAAVFTLGLAGAILVTLINLIGSFFGVASDFPGLASVPLVAGLSLFVQVPLVLVGGALVSIWQRSTHA